LLIAFNIILFMLAVHLWRLTFWFETLQQSSVHWNNVRLFAPPCGLYVGQC